MSETQVTVGDICEQVRGVTYSADEATDEPRLNQLPIIRANNITDEGLLLERLVYVPSSRISAKQRVRKGDVVIAASSGSLSVVGKAAQSKHDFDGGFGAFCKVLRPTKGVNADYFAHFFKTQQYRRQVSSLAAGVNINNLRSEHLSNLVFFLPPLDEQRRIAAILDQAEALRAQRRAAVALLDALAQAIFEEMFGASQQQPNGRVTDLVDCFESGKSLAADDENDAASVYRVLKVSAVTTGVYLPMQSKALPPDYRPPASHFVRAGDLLISRANTKELIGATAYVESTPANILLSDKIWRFVWAEPKRASARYVQYLFRQSKVRGEMAALSSGTSGSMKNVSQANVLGIRVDVPTLDRQMAFERRIEALDHLKSTHLTALAHLDALFASLQHRAFRGEL